MVSGPTTDSGYSARMVASTASFFAWGTLVAPARIWREP